MIENISLKMAKVLKDKSEHPASEAVLSYSIQLIINTASILISTMILGIINGRFIEVLLALVSFAVLRQVSGGYHLKSGVLCIIVSTLLITLLSFASLDQTQCLILNCISLFLVVIFSPSIIERQTRISPKYFRWFKIGSILLVLSSFMMLNPVVTASFFVQALTLIRWRG
ncbi:accessory gene regulator ArgB-like protein [Paenibacillus aurantiacus]|uniref:Accessory gene regulator ArgB-like protein n=1 Tax=Paenibacillus aurantiacus TaxID=1936118 RepID=A0ABV5KJG8_9BACL